MLEIMAGALGGLIIAGGLIYVVIVGLYTAWEWWEQRRHPTPPTKLRSMWAPKPPPDSN